MTLIVGLMSGTSLDGISAALVRFSRDDQRIRAKLIGHDVLAYDDAQRDRLARALRGATPEEYCRLNFDLGALLARAALKVIDAANVSRGDVDLVASHGQTIWHVPGHSTWQVGESAMIAELTGIPVVSDFRARDMAAGGQGAPLVPMADCLLFHAPHWRALQNVGGIGNVTVVPPNGGPDGVRAFDTGPGMVVIDGIVRMLRPTLPYDIDGKLASRGTPIDSVVDEALRDPYFAARPPKSTGRELFTYGYIGDFIDRCRAARPRATPDDILATAVQFTARSIADAYERFVPEPIEDVVVSGGGAKNLALMAALARRLPGRNVVRFHDVFFDGEAKEAVAFALLAFLHLSGMAGNVADATGAAGPRILGKLSPGPVRRM